MTLLRNPGALTQKTRTTELFQVHRKHLLLRRSSQFFHGKNKKNKLPASEPELTRINHTLEHGTPANTKITNVSKWLATTFRIAKFRPVHGVETRALKNGFFIFRDWPMPQSRKIKNSVFQVCLLSSLHPVRELIHSHWLACTKHYFVLMGVSVAPRI